MKLFERNLHVYKVSGKDSFDLLNRISTNNCLVLEETQSLSTMLLDDKGKLIDLLYLFICDDSLYMISHFSEKTILWIDKFIFTEDISFEKVNARVYEKLDSFQKSGWNYLSKYSDTVLEVTSFQGRRFFVDFNNEMEENSNEEEYSDYRIENLLADFNFEINDKSIPLELGFIDAISFKKGCYIGQEIIARLESLHKVSKYLARLCVLQAIKDNCDKILYSEKGQEIGRITTISSNGESVLAIIHKSKIEKGSKLFIGNDKIEAYVELSLTDKTYQNL